jgi:uncharacterized protein (TIGR01777 family)
MKIVVSGSSGLVGSPLVQALEARGDTVVRLVHGRQWDLDRNVIDRASLEGSDAVIHLAGENIFGRWTEAKKQRVRDSRVRGTRLLSNTLVGLTRPPTVLLAASAVGYYGDRGSQTLTESSSPGHDFLAEVAREWEEATGSAARAGIRVVNMRFGIVLSPAGGALGKMLTPFRMGLGGPIAGGTQYVSWIARPDLVAAIQHVLDKRDVSGPVNLTAPNPVTNREFATTLGKVLGRPAIVPVPAFALRMAFGADGAAMLQAGQRVLPERLLASGFQFDFPAIEAALRHLLARSDSGR